jgi:mRNA-degrading endonuclease toxin of MazEF toxin-antitoxin module
MLIFTNEFNSLHEEELGLQVSLDVAKNQLDLYYGSKTTLTDEEEKNLVRSYFSWIQKKTEIITNEKSFSIPAGVTIKRGSVFWIEFGYNIDQEFGGRHPGIVLRQGGNTAIVVPLSTQEPTENQKQSGLYAEISRVYEFTRMRRWVNVLNAAPISIQRFDFSDTIGNVKGPELDKINEAMVKSGLWKLMPPKETN